VNNYLYYPSGFLDFFFSYLSSICWLSSRNIADKSFVFWSPDTINT